MYNCQRQEYTKCYAIRQQVFTFFLTKFYFLPFYRIVSNEGVVIYVDPYAGEGYDMPADIVIVTHEHSDHNQVDLVTLKDDGVILTRREQESPPPL